MTVSHANLLSPAKGSPLPASTLQGFVWLAYPSLGIGLCLHTLFRLDVCRSSAEALGDPGQAGCGSHPQDMESGRGKGDSQMLLTGGRDRVTLSEVVGQGFSDQDSKQAVQNPLLPSSLSQPCKGVC